jgi:hypothetical protein
VPLDALGLALAAAVVYALWNLLLARAPHPDAALAIGLASAVVIFVSVAAATWRVDSAAWPHVAGRAAFELVCAGCIAGYTLVDNTGITRAGVVVAGIVLLGV